MVWTVALISVVATFLVIVLDVRLRKAKLKTQHNAQEKSPKQGAKWIYFVCGLLFLIVGVWMTFSPPAPPFGTRGLVLELAYLAVGKYGPASVLLAFSGMAFFKLYQLLCNR